MKKKIGIIVQARMGSTRLPGKILKPFFRGQSILDILLNTLHKATDANVIVATSTNKENDALEERLTKNGEIVFRGSENDVLERFICAAESNNLDCIIRICSDNPFIDLDGIKKLIDMGMSCDCDYLGYRVNGKPSILTHFGFWGEYVTIDALKKVFNRTEVGTAAHEHVTNYIYTHPDEFNCKWINVPDFIENRNDIRLTVDTVSDFENARTVYSDISAHSNPISLKEIVNYIDAHSGLKGSMQENIEKNNK